MVVIEVPFGLLIARKCARVVRIWVETFQIVLSRVVCDSVPSRKSDLLNSEIETRILSRLSRIFKIMGFNRLPILVSTIYISD